jgi:hypothetical protein
MQRRHLAAAEINKDSDDEEDQFAVFRKKPAVSSSN